MLSEARVNVMRNEPPAPFRSIPRSAVNPSASASRVRIIEKLDGLSRMNRIGREPLTRASMKIGAPGEYCTGTTTRGACASATLAIDKAAPAAAIALRRFTNEARRIVEASRALVLRDLRIWTERPRPIRDATAHVRRHDLGWRLSVLHPLLQCPERVETARTFTTA